MFGQRPQFGTSTSFGGFGSTANQSVGFGTTFGRPTFGTTTQSSGFGTTPFGSSISTGTSLFGQATQTSGGLFGSQQKSGGLFGSAPTGFGTQQNRPFGFGTTTTTSSGGLFGSTPSGSLFGSSAPFGSTGQVSGTTIKFNPVTCTDTMSKNGVSQNIQTRIQVITCMKEYETKTFEELRVEDYLAGRKSGGAGVFGTAQTTTNTGLFGTQNTNTGLFGQKTETKPLFGSSTSSGFGTPSFGTGLFGSTTTTPSFGSTNTSTGFSFGNQNKGTGFNFGTSSTPSFFGQQTTTANSGFGSSGFSFGQQQQTGTGLFGQNKPAFGAPASTSTSLFGTKPLGSSSFGTFGSSASTPFGASTTSNTGFFGNTANQNKTGFTLGTTPTFGTGTGFGTSGGSLFGNTQNKTNNFSFGNPGTFGTNTSSGLTFGSGTNTGSGLFGTGTNFSSGSSFGNLGASFGFNTSQQPTNLPITGTSNNANIANLIKALTTNPFGNSSLLKNAVPPTGKADELLNSPPSKNGETEKTGNSISRKPTYVLPSTGSNKIKPLPVSKNNAGSVRHMLFAGLEENAETDADDPFKSKSYPSIKKLNLKVFSAKNSPQRSSESTLLNGSSPLTTSLSLQNNDTAGAESPEQTPAVPIETSALENMKNHTNKSKPLSQSNLNDTLTDLNVPSSGNRAVNSSYINGDIEANKENQDISFANSLNSDDEPIVNHSAAPHPAGIKLSRSGYYTLPPLYDLADMIDSDGKCLVDNFTVGRMGYGNVCFPGITDVFGLHLDKIIFIVRKEIEVYPDDAEKPPPGEGLNKSAIVTLDCVWPVDKTTREVIKSQERLDSMRWIDYLERQCVKMDATFIEYRSETGSWVFKVKHFSKYGLQDEDEEPVQMESSQVPPSSIPHVYKSHEITGITSVIHQHSSIPVSCAATTTTTSFMQGSAYASKLLERPSVPLYSPSQESAYPCSASVSLPDVGLEDSTGMTSYMEEAREPDEGAHMNVLSPGSERLTLSSKLPPKTIQAMKSSFFMNEEDNFKDAVEPPVAHATKKLMLAFDSPTKPASEVTGSQTDTSSVKPKNRVISTIVPSIPSLPVKEINDSCGLRDLRSAYPVISLEKEHYAEHVYVKPQCLDQDIALQDSSIKDLDHCIQDAAAFMSRSFRIGWGPGWSFVHPGLPLGFCNSNSHTQKDHAESDYENSFLFMTSRQSVERIKYKLSVEKVSLSSMNENINELIVNSLQRVLEFSISTEEGKRHKGYCPFFHPVTEIEFLHELASTVKEIDDDGKFIISDILSLCVALWGRMEFYFKELGEDENYYAEARARVEAFSFWLEMVNSKNIEEEICKSIASDDDGYLNAIFAYLTTRNISKACSLAEKKGDYHLALLISQACLGQDSSRQIIAQQLLNWAEGGSDAHISPLRLALYCLLAAKPTHSASNIFVNVCQGLDWRRTFALHLWYIYSSTCTLSEALTSFEKAVSITSDREAYCSEPFPPYISSIPKTSTASYDVCYHLLKLFCNSTHSLEILLDPSSNNPDPLDVVTSWLLWRVLESLGYHHMSEAQNSNLHLSMAGLLESLGMWEWSVFVILNLTNEDQREMEVKSLLMRYVLLASEDQHDSSYMEMEEFIIKKLHIPYTWLCEAKSIRAKSLKRVEEEAWYLIEAEQYNKAHSLIVDSIAPNCIINEIHHYLRKYLSKLSSESVQKRIPDWSSGGGVYVDYLEVIALVEDLKQTGDLTPAKLEELRPRLLALCSQLNSLKCPTAVHRLCVSEMSRVVVGVMRAIVGEGVEATQVLAQQISAMPLTHDYALEELNLITTQYLTQIAKLL